MVDSPTKAEFKALQSDFHAQNIRLARIEAALKPGTWLLAANLAGVLGILAILLVG